MILTTIIFSIYGFGWSAALILIVYLFFRRRRVKKEEDFEQRGN